jgi:hypothetical protein
MILKICRILTKINHYYYLQHQKILLINKITQSNIYYEHVPYVDKKNYLSY